MQVSAAVLIPPSAELTVIRSHWGIENELHWCLALRGAFGEDDSRLHKGDGAQNFSFLRRLALTLLKRETSAIMGLKAKRHKAGWDNDYLLTVLAATQDVIALTGWLSGNSSGL